MRAALAEWTLTTPWTSTSMDETNKDEDAEDDDEAKAAPHSQRTNRIERQDGRRYGRQRRRFACSKLLAQLLELVTTVEFSEETGKGHIGIDCTCFDCPTHQILNIQPRRASINMMQTGGENDNMKTTAILYMMKKKKDEEVDV